MLKILLIDLMGILVILKWSLFIHGEVLRSIWILYLEKLCIVSLLLQMLLILQTIIEFINLEIVMIEIDILKLLLLRFLSHLLLVGKLIIGIDFIYQYWSKVFWVLTRIDI